MLKGFGRANIMAFFSFWAALTRCPDFGLGLAVVIAQEHAASPAARNLKKRTKIVLFLLLVSRR